MKGCPDFFSELNLELAFWYRVVFLHFTPRTAQNDGLSVLMRKLANAFRVSESGPVAKLRTLKVILTGRRKDSFSQQVSLLQDLEPYPVGMHCPAIRSVGGEVGQPSLAVCAPRLASPLAHQRLSREPSWSCTYQERVPPVH
jgi:hypothetical protein